MREILSIRPDGNNEKVRSERYKIVEMGISETEINTVYQTLMECILCILTLFTE